MPKVKPTLSQRRLMERLDQGWSIKHIGYALGKSVTAVKRQITRINRRVREGHYAPAPLPIEVAASAPRIYLAGFDVFRINAKAHGEELKHLCRDRGFVGLYPLEGHVPSALEPQEAARWIYATNIELIRSVDYVVANLDDFRGSGEPDCGTAFEVGFAVALGKPVWTYRSNDEMLIQRVESTSIPGSGAVCSLGFLVEDFGLSVNLMLACSVHMVVGIASACLDALKRSLDARGEVPGGYGVGEAAASLEVGLGEIQYIYL